MQRPKFFLYFFITLAILVIAIVGVITANNVVNITDDKNIAINLVYSHSAVLNDNIIYLAYAISESEQMTGLSHQKSIEDNQGLLFSFKEPEKQGIWMKDMNFPIDVMWLDKNFKIIFIKNDFSPQSYPEIIYPPTNSSFVLETKAGYAKSHQIEIGDTLEILKKE